MSVRKIALQSVEKCFAKVHVMYLARWHIFTWGRLGHMLGELRRTEGNKFGEDVSILTSLVSISSGLTSISSGYHLGENKFVQTRRIQQAE